MKLQYFDKCLDYQCFHYHKTLSLIWSPALFIVVVYLSLTSLLHKEVTLVLGLQGPPAAVAVVVDADEGTVSSRDPCLEAPYPVAWPCSPLHKRDQASAPPMKPWGLLLGWEASLNAGDKHKEMILDLSNLKSLVVINRLICV